MNTVISLLIGAGAGAACTYFAKSGVSSSDNNKIKTELDSLYSENEKLRKRYKEAERENEDLLAEVEKLRRKLKSYEENHEDLNDDYEDVSKKLKTAISENTDLKRKLSEYKAACDSLEKELGTLKKSK